MRLSENHRKFIGLPSDPVAALFAWAARYGAHGEIGCEGVKAAGGGRVPLRDVVGDKATLLSSHGPQVFLGVYCGAAGAESRPLAAANECAIGSSLNGDAGPALRTDGAPVWTAARLRRDGPALWLAEAPRAEPGGAWMP